MYEYVAKYKDIAESVYQEILSDSSSSWFVPKGPPQGGPKKGDFDEGNMRFVNRNLNYLYIENMIVHALRDDYDYNTNYPTLLKFCNDARPEVNQTGPFGRMCIWKLKPHCSILPHYDRWEYHHQITRYIFCVSDHSCNDVVINIGDKEIQVEQGLFFNFYPSTEKHTFSNKTDRDFYFIGYDYWKPDCLATLAQEKGLTKDSVVPYMDGFGGFNKTTKYMSPE